MKYTLTSTEFNGEIVFDFDKDGYLTTFDASAAELNEAQRYWVLNKLPRSEALLQRLLGKSQTARLTPVKKDYSFDEFWNRYNEKARSSKKKTQQRWNRISQTQRNRAYLYISIYERNILPGVAKKYAETYLNAELWNN